jgi:hypothetical protein
MKMKTGYNEIIVQATGCSLPDAEDVEEIMRGVIFHSTLDWQTRDELEVGARIAYAVLQNMRRASHPRHAAWGGSSGRQKRRSVEVVFALSQSHYTVLKGIFWSIPDSVPGLTACRLEWLPRQDFWLQLAGSRRAVTRAARMAGIAEDEIQRALREYDAFGDS